METGTATIAGTLVVFAPVAILAGLLTSGLIVLLMPWLRAYALARPNARSSHREPIPEGGGAAVILATLAAAWAAAFIAGMYPLATGAELPALTVAVILLATVGAVDDLRDLPALPRLLLQCLAVGIAIAALPHDLRVVPMLPWGIERACLFLCVLWFVNLTNFMDGVDWMTVAEVVPISGAIVLLGLLDVVGALPTLVALVLLGAMLGFAPFNRPVAKLFLGDVGSLPIGLLLAWLLIRVAASGDFAAAMILPLYYVADATLTLGRRLANGERVWQAHRTHFYQRALDGGFSVSEIVTRVFLVNLALVALATMVVVNPSGLLTLVAVTIAVALVGWLLALFAMGERLMRILVTGASGFVGRALVNDLAAQHRVRAAMRQPADIFPRQVEVVAVSDLARPIEWRPLLQDIDAVVHLAGIAHTGPGVTEDAYDRVNRAATAGLAAAGGIRRLIFVSSIRAQAGAASAHVLTETDVPRPTDAYGRSKLAAEMAVRAVNVPFTILRPALIYGPGVKGNLESLLKLAASPWPLPFGALRNRRSLLARQNLIAAIYLVIAEPAAVGETYLVADPVALTMGEIVRALRSGQGRRARLWPIPPALVAAPLKAFGRSYLWERVGGDLVVEPAKLLAAGWRPPIETQAGLAAMAQAAAPRKSGTASYKTP